MDENLLCDGLNILERISYVKKNQEGMKSFRSSAFLMNPGKVPRNKGFSSQTIKNKG